MIYILVKVHGDSVGSPEFIEMISSELDRIRRFGWMMMKNNTGDYDNIPGLAYHMELREYETDAPHCGFRRISLDDGYAEWKLENDASSLHFEDAMDPGDDPNDLTKAKAYINGGRWENLTDEQKAPWFEKARNRIG